MHKTCNHNNFSQLQLGSAAALLLLILCCYSSASWTAVRAQAQCGTDAGGATCANNLCCSQYGFCGSTSDYCGNGCQSGPCTGSTGGGRAGGGGVSSIVTSDVFSQFLSQNSASGCPSNGFYTYDAFIAAAASFSGFGTTGGSDVQKQELAAFFANVAHETGSGCYVEEINKGTYCDPSTVPCASGQQYYGRGPLQLTWNYNYQAAGQAVGFDGINNPGVVAQDPTISFKTALWFWMTQQSPTCHDAMANNQGGFGATIRAINGGLECGSSANVAQQQDRISRYQSFCSILGVDPGSNLTC